MRMNVSVLIEVNRDPPGRVYFWEGEGYVSMDLVAPAARAPPNLPFVESDDEEEYDLPPEPEPRALEPLVKKVRVGQDETKEKKPVTVEEPAPETAESIKK
ncbi:uncharacterized protein K452DRAFT_303670 [Aplosporella prunicola CBS 121167]|uniref:Uncharacterized protein n=1 Tax=Aplosporella prunicola CBS 121167 TaxID=1176127 RepID=A0A6A6AWV7_9PEZI|nr:uncharacterized protein K452DRAFT_303670 [Aplosporella prunicola CBS 121167]KAF2135267.1 hypothetical protein K452DRAFT_303670 [Aplosporella prunicola CBS 121167]